MTQHDALTEQYDSLAWISDPDTDGGLVSKSALDGGEARAIAETLTEAGYTVSTAPDSDERGKRWIYCIPPQDTEIA